MTDSQTDKKTIMAGHPVQYNRRGSRAVLGTPRSTGCHHKKHVAPKIQERNLAVAVDGGEAT